MLVGVTGLEPATSRPPAVRATNCATPRKNATESPALLYSILDDWVADMINLERNQVGYLTYQPRSVKILNSHSNM